MIRATDGELTDVIWEAPPPHRTDLSGMTENSLTNERASSGRASGTSLMWARPQDIRDHRDGGLWKAKYGTFDNYQEFAGTSSASTPTGSWMPGISWSPIGGNAPIPTHELRSGLCQLARPEDRAKAWAELSKNRVHAVATCGRAPDAR